MAVLLGRADLSLLSDPVGTRVVIPFLMSAPRTRSRAGTLVQFEGDQFPTSFRGSSRSGSVDLTARYGEADQALAADLIDLIDVIAPASPDHRLLLRTHVRVVAGLDPVLAVVVSSVQEAPQVGRYIDLSFTATVVQHDLAV